MESILCSGASTHLPEPDWNRFLSETGARVVVAEYEDRFGARHRLRLRRLRIKIAVIAGCEECSSFSVHAWVMSCRTFSRRIEHQRLKLLLERWDPVELQFKKTERNGPLEEFLAQIGNGQPITRRNFEKNCPKLFHETEVIDD